MTKSFLPAAWLTLLAALLHIALTGARAAGDDSVTSVQGALKKHGFYEGEPSGQLDPPTRAALKRFQIRHGFEATGELDAGTVEALTRGGRSRAEAAIEPSIRERAREVVRSDKEFLDKVEFLDHSDATPPATPPARSAPAAKPEPPVRRAAPPAGASPPDTARSPSTATEASPPLQPEKLHRFLDEYLRVAQGETPDGEVALYADEVDYFDSGRVSRKAVEKDQRAYYRRWPSRKFTLTGEPTFERISDRVATVRFRMRYALRRGEESASGRTENVLRVQQTDDGLRIAGIRERKVTD